MRDDADPEHQPTDPPDGRRAAHLLQLRGHLDRRRTDLHTAASAPAALTSPPTPDRRQTLATLAQALGLLALLTTLFVVPAIPLGIASIALGIRLRRHLQATGQPTRPADTAIATGAAALIIATSLLVYLQRHDAFY